MSIGEGRNVDRLVNRELRLSAQLSLRHNRPIQIPHYCGHCTDPPVSLALPPFLTHEWGKDGALCWDIKHEMYIMHNMLVAVYKNTIQCRSLLPVLITHVERQREQGLLNLGESAIGMNEPWIREINFFACLFVPLINHIYELFREAVFWHLSEHVHHQPSFRSQWNVFLFSWDHWKGGKSV